MRGRDRRVDATTYAVSARAVSEAVRRLDGLKGLVTDPEILDGYRRDQAAPGLLNAGEPAGLVRPTSTDEVQKAVRAARRAATPVVPRGAGSGLSGGANAIDGCLVVSLERMSQIKEIDERSMTATVQPGVVNDVLRAAARSQGLWYAPDPASMEFSTIGGNVATNAGGLCCVKYGVTRDAVIGLEVVLADGSVVKLGRRTRKGVAGYDVVALMCGSEGTLGVVTEITVKLLPLPKPPSTLAASFSQLAAAGHAIERIVREHVPSLLEIMDNTTINAVEEMAPMELDRGAEAMIFACSDVGFEMVERMARCCEQCGATLVVTSDDPAEGRMLMTARRLAYPALERTGSTLLDDVAVPLRAVPTFLMKIPRIAEREDVTIGTFGHAGDGNMHPTIVYDVHDASSVRRARAAFVAIVSLVVSLGGTVTGEHGVGILKLQSMQFEFGRSRRVHRAIKDALDPDNLLNPGKAV